MYFDIWKMLLGVYDRLYNLQAHRTSLAQLMTGALPVVQQRYPIYNNFVKHAQAFIDANNIALTDSNLVAKINNFVQVAVPELLSDPIFSLEPATSYENLHAFETEMPVLRPLFEGLVKGLDMDTLKEAIRAENYRGAVDAIQEMVSRVVYIVNDRYPSALFETVINTSISSTVTKYTIIQYVCAACQLIAAVLVAPIALLQWILTKLNLETITIILAYISFVTIDALLWIINLLLRQVYGAGVYAYLSSYIGDHTNANGPFVTHLEPEQLESLKLLDIIYCNKYVVGYESLN
jgi:hypothetical protein